jgi:hypothetical protein
LLKKNDILAILFLEEYLKGRIGIKTILFIERKKIR